MARAKTLSRTRHLRVLRSPKVEQDASNVLHRPSKRSECANVPRPCPFVSCRYHLYLDVNPRSGSIKLNFPSIEPHELRESCALDVADRGELQLHLVGRFMNVTRERIRQLENKVIAQVLANESLAAPLRYGMTDALVPGEVRDPPPPPSAPPSPPSPEESEEALPEEAEEPAPLFVRRQHLYAVPHEEVYAALWGRRS